jgi:signal transduction histidine kinase
MRVRAALVDFGRAAAITAFLVLASAHIAPGRHDHALGVLGYALVVSAGASLGFVRRHPWPVTVFLAADLAAYLFGRYAGGPVFVTSWVALFFLGGHARRRDAFVAAGALSAVVVGAGVLAGRSEPLLHLVFVGWSGAAVFLGDALRGRRQHLADVQERARELARRREADTARRLAEERLRIARDLHDSVAHAMATINVQAGAAAHVVDRRPEAARDALRAIQRSSADVLDELSALLGLLRNGAAADAERAPVPGLDRVGELLESARQAGLDVGLEVDGPLDAVPPTVATAAYRVVQESLTNVVRHSHATGARVHVAAADDGGLRVDVEDAGPAKHDATGTGMGLVGMRERVDATGGTLVAAPRPDGGFRVTATWPGRT